MERRYPLREYAARAPYPLRGYGRRLFFVSIPLRKNTTLNVPYQPLVPFFASSHKQKQKRFSEPVRLPIDNQKNNKFNALKKSSEKNGLSTAGVMI